jgi:4-diphosphocytidyl-2-C-methyl-D-erythritol kinase
VLLYRCYAKVNLALEVLGPRADGYHDLVSLVHTINLADDLRVERANEVVCRAEGLEGEPEVNLVAQAADLLRETARVHAGADLTLIKHIPVAAGLGGGSADAAAALVALNGLWATRLRYSQLGGLAAQLGSDVPFFLRGGAALMCGRGERLEPLRPLPDQWLTLGVLPHALPDKTATLYASLAPSDYSNGVSTRRAAAYLNDRRALDEADLRNAFARAARDVFPGLAAAWRDAEAACGRRFHLSGAGPALFALATDRADAQRVAADLEKLGLPAYAARTVGHARASVKVADHT